MLRYYGLYAMPDKKTDRLIHLMQRHMREILLIRQHWVFRIEASFHHDPLKCPCGGYMEFKDIYIPNSGKPPPSMLQYGYL